MNQADLAAMLPSLLPLASEWATAQWELAMQIGSPLHAVSLADAEAVGVRDPEAVRVVIVDKIPQPETYPALMLATQALQFLDETTIGLAINTAIFIRRDHAGERQLVAHELTHVAQYEALGGIPEFLVAYFGQVIEFGYHKAPMEREAVNNAEAVPEEILP